ncbi:hypothetical protein MARINOS108_10569 [Marinoscillum sp. 108]|nr:hypothetical protein MARINOS108_10569 [Marinoscillum sp. 108]
MRSIGHLCEVFEWWVFWDQFKVLLNCSTLNQKVSNNDETPTTFSYLEQSINTPAAEEISLFAETCYGPDLRDTTFRSH